jgi:hypothetical protein
MKKIFFLAIIAAASFTAGAQEFNKQLAAARTAYSAGKLEDARFAMQQMLQELDILTGKEVLKLLPVKMQEQNAVSAKDNVTGASGFAGVIVHREYGAADKKVELEIITNSPLIATLNSLLSLPIIGTSGDNKVIKVGGYKALVQKSTGENDKATYEIQLPLNSSLITLRAPGYTEDQVIKMMNTLAVGDIARVIQ